MPPPTTRKSVVRAAASTVLRALSPSGGGRGGRLAGRGPVPAPPARRGEGLPQRVDVVERRVLIVTERRLGTDGRRDLADARGHGPLGLEPEHPADLREADAIIPQVGPVPLPRDLDVAHD